MDPACDVTSNQQPITVIGTDETWRGTVVAALRAGGFVDVRPTGQPSLTSPDSRLAVVGGDSSSLGAALLEVPTEVAVLAVGPNDASVMVRMIENGAIGYVLDDVPFAQLVQAVDQALDGHAVIPSHMLGSLLRRVVERRRLERADRERLQSLTDRERDVLDLIAQGMGNEELAGHLYISPATARTHLQRVFKKLGIHSRAEAVAFAARCGISTERNEQ